MVEIKINDRFSDEVEALRQAGKMLNDDYVTLDDAGVDTLQTAVKYIEQHHQIKELLDQHKNLLLKDAEDFDQLVQTMKTADESTKW